MYITSQHTTTVLVLSRERITTSLVLTRGYYIMTINGVHHDHAGTNAGENHNHVTIILILHTTMLVITHEYITTRTGSLSLTAPRTLQRGLAMSQARHGLNSATRLRALCDAGTDTAYGALISSDVSRRVQNVRY